MKICKICGDQFVRHELDNDLCEQCIKSNLQLEDTIKEKKYFKLITDFTRKPLWKKYEKKYFIIWNYIRKILLKPWMMPVLLIWIILLLQDIASDTHSINYSANYIEYSTSNLDSVLSDIQTDVSSIESNTR